MQLDIKGGQTWNKEWINSGPTKLGGELFYKDIVNMNENYINYIQYNPKIIQTVDDLAVADTGTTGHYLTLDSPCENKQQAVNPLPIQILNGEIITSTHTTLLSQQYLPIQARKAHISQVSTRPCCSLENQLIKDDKPHLMTSMYSFSTKE